MALKSPFPRQKGGANRRIQVSVPATSARFGFGSLGSNARILNIEHASGPETIKQRYCERTTKN